jgi:hypothetical protein
MEQSRVGFTEAQMIFRKGLIKATKNYRGDIQRALIGMYKNQAELSDRVRVATNHLTPKQKAQVIKEVCIMIGA